MARFCRTNRRHFRQLLMSLLFVAAIVAPGTLFAQQQTVKHLNPVVEKLAAGKPFIGFQSADFSLENARNLARPISIMCTWRWSTDRWILKGCIGSLWG